MPDIATVWDGALCHADWVASGGALQGGDPLVTAVIISVFTDRGADPDDVIPDGTDDRRGWWGDLGEDRPIGSKLWLRVRAKQSQETLAKVRQDLIEALAWMVDDGVAARVDVLCEWSRPGFLGAQVTVWRQAGGAAADLRFEWAWQGGAST